MRKIIAVALLCTVIPPLAAQIQHGLRDGRGRHLIPRGYVVNTNDGEGPITFSADDYARMVRMGANAQVIRLELGRLSTFPGCQLEEAYLEKLDRLVVLGRNAGFHTVFKMTVYGVKGFSWEGFWANENGEHGTYLEAWKAIWSRYKDDDSVLGYDLLNEPRKLTMEISYDELTDDYLISFYRFLIDEANQIADAKQYLCQSVFMNKGEAINGNQYAEIKTPIDRENIVFSPHIYQEKIDLIDPTMERFDKESKVLDAPILIGEWGFPTFATTDKSVPEQLDYMAFYIHTAEAFDRLGVGTIKAWFSGNRTMQDFLPGGPSTWAIFSDEKAVGTVERKYITDIIARPYPQVIAGDIRSFMFNHATRTLDVSVKTDNSKGSSRIFVGADRHYPDGFTIQVNDGLVLSRNPLRSAGLEVYRSAAGNNPDDFVWDESRQQLIILQWPFDGADVSMRISPGINNSPISTR